MSVSPPRGKKKRRRRKEYRNDGKISRGRDRERDGEGERFSTV